MEQEIHYIGKIDLLLPCKCIKKISPSLMEKNGGKWYIREVKCNTHNKVIRDRFLKKISDNKFKVIDDLKKEKRIMREEENFIVEIYSQKLAKCSFCNADIYGKNVLSAEHLRRTLWEIEYRCGECGDTDIIEFDELDLP